MSSSLSTSPACRRLRAKLPSAPSLLALLVAGGACVPAAAQISDVLHPYVAASYSYDDNLLRLPESATAAYGGLSDHSRSLVGGLRFEQTYGRQQVSADLSASRVSFDRFNQYDYTGKNGRATWLWKLGNHLDGKVGLTYDQTLTPFNDFRSDQRNLRTQRGVQFDGGWRFHPSWRVRVGGSRADYDYELLAQQVLNRETKARLVGLDYVSTTGSSIGLQARREDGDYDNPVRSGNQRFLQNYTQEELQLKVFWRLGEVSQLELLAGRAKRKHDLALLGDPSATTGRVSFTWSPLATVRVVASARRDFDAFEGIGVNYTLTKGANLDATWAATSKIALRAQLKHYKRDFGAGNGAFVLPPNLNDSVNGGTLGVTWNPHQRIQLGLSVSREQRSSNSAFSNSYRSNSASANASIEF